MTDTIHWFEIQVTDFNRVKNFFEILFYAAIIELPLTGSKYGMLPTNMQNGVGGGIVLGEGFTPSSSKI
ncbi:MAG: hypothetical protein IPI46_07185 [Bacteroidetes bacterium]|nr:hypothetical protein [Bacteroidota bacterium]